MKKTALFTFLFLNTASALEINAWDGSFAYQTINVTEVDTGYEISFKNDSWRQYDSPFKLGTVPFPMPSMEFYVYMKFPKSLCVMEKNEKEFQSLHCSKKGDLSKTVFYGTTVFGREEFNDLPFRMIDHSILEEEVSFLLDRSHVKAAVFNSAGLLQVEIAFKLKAITTDGRDFGKETFPEELRDFLR